MILSQIEHYWTGRAEGYSQVNQHELSTGQDRVWFREISRYPAAEKADWVLSPTQEPSIMEILRKS